MRYLRGGVAPVSTKLGVACPLMGMVICLCELRGVYACRGEGLLGVTRENESQVQIPFIYLFKYLFGCIRS